jgi:hypothetical protein
VTFGTQFRRDAIALNRPASAETRISETDLACVPPSVQRYLLAAGVVGRPRVRNYRVTFSGRIRSAPGSRWMPFTAIQHSFVNPPARLFLMRATLFGFPVRAFHQYVEGRARMRVTACGLLPLVDASGPELDRSETVTLFNDMCLLAPATLLDAPVQWEQVDCRTVDAAFTNGDHTISATLVFAKDGRLTNFVSDDRSRASADGKTLTRLQFSTPVRSCRDFAAVRLASHGDARWALPEGPFTYGEFDIRSIDYNVAP